MNYILSLSKKILKDTALLFLVTGISLSLKYRVTYGATQGTSGSTSTGTLDISIALAEVVQVSALNDIIFPVWGGTGDMTEFDDLCIYSNTAGGGYKVTVNGSGAGGIFEVTDGSNTMIYNAYWNDQALPTGVSSLTANVQLTGQTGASTDSLDCSSGSSLTSRIVVEFLDATLSAAPVSVYGGTITLTIEPE
jgi:hypothetical protein